MNHSNKNQKIENNKHKYFFNEGSALAPWREKIYEIIFEAETLAGKLFDILLIFTILISVLAVMLDSVAVISEKYRWQLFIAEWTFTIVFTIEYILRLISVRKPFLYARSFYGIIDILSIIPTYLSLILVNAKYFLVIRILRVLRIFRIFKLVSYIGEANLMIEALKNSRKKIAIFLYTVILIVVIFGSLIFVIEGGKNGFTSIPQSVYWAVVTLTTVGYGDMVPHTAIGKFLAGTIMILGYGLIAVPTGIYGAEIARIALTEKELQNITCSNCNAKGHDAKALYCNHCGEKLTESAAS